jgi:hypothetical protein
MITVSPPVLPVAPLAPVSPVDPVAPVAPAGPAGPGTAITTGGAAAGCLSHALSATAISAAETAIEYFMIDSFQNV